MKNKALTFAIFGLVVCLTLGVALPLILSGMDFTPEPNPAVGATYVTVCGLLLVILTVEIVSMFKIDDSTFHTALISGSLAVMYFFSADMELFLVYFDVTVSKVVFEICSEMVFIFALVCCCWFMTYTYRLNVKGKTLATVAVPLVIALIGFFVTVIYGYGYIAHFVIVALLSLAFCLVLARAEHKTPIGITTYLAVATFCLSVGAQSVNALYYSGLSVAVSGLTLAFAVLTVCMFFGVYLAFSIRTDIKAVRSTQYQHQAELFETKALSQQIKPHFVFNSLEAVRALYHKDIASGDAALNLLTNFLRGSIDSFDNELVPFETEIDNVFSYTEFENLKRQNKIEVIYDIDFTDFVVPPFSVQPFVENAIKYSGVDCIENGKIIISSYKEGSCAVVEITDNGKGFDVNNVSDSSHGIKNACGRFKLALGTVPQITSAQGLGTQVKIVIDLNKKGKS